jgi:laminin gamma 1
VGNCDTQSNEEICLRCIFNTTGQNCELCKPNYWGDALSTKKCHACDCFPLGTFTNELGHVEQCNLNDGQCACKPNVLNRDCSECKDGYWNIKSGKGCEQCNCNPLGSYNQSCNINTGQCYCRPGVQGLKCDSCAPMWYVI